MRDQNQLPQNSRNRVDKHSGQARSIAKARHLPGGFLDRQDDCGTPLSDHELNKMVSRGLWSLLGFLLVSMAAFMIQDFNLYQSLPESILQVLGCPPPEFLTHLAITGYTFTVAVPVLIRIATGAAPTMRWHHLASRSVFYVFYLMSNTLAANFAAVMFIGIVLYVMEQAGIWCYRRKEAQI